MFIEHSRFVSKATVAYALLCGWLLLVVMWPATVSAQTADAEQRAEEALATEETDTGQDEAASGDDGDEAAINLLDLLQRGGVLMIPILLMSILVVAFGLERIIGLRREKILPEEFLIQLGAMSSRPGSFDPRRAYRLCQQYPSSAATVLRAMLLKVGRPHTEVERAVREASEREGNRLHRNVRTLNLAATVTPLLGLLGTVWGMIQAFFVTANMPVGANKAEALAEGIYVALVTTFTGLAVAIPAALLAHFFEGRIELRLRQVEELAESVLPLIEPLEGQLRVHLGEEQRAAPAAERASDAPQTVPQS
jgi:biopolymer transport protein ExbB